jgi:hypothetical protein
VLVGDTGDGAKEGGSHLGDEFFFAVKLVAETCAESAVEAAFVSTCVDQFMK